VNAPYKIYSALASVFGPQGWWPVTPEGHVRPLYKRGRFKLRSDRERFEVAVGAILTQNTAWTNVERALVNLNVAGGISPETVLKTDSARLAGLIRSSGYYVQKEKKLRLFSEYLVAKHPEGLGKWLGGPLTGVRAEILSLWGIGGETADSILLYAGARKTFVADAYTVRLGRRMGWFETNDYDAVKNFFEKALPRDLEVFNEFHALIVALGKDFCKPRPLCAECPLRRLCGKKGVV